MKEIKRYCFLCAELPSIDCIKYHPRCVENDMGEFSERWARGLLGDEEYWKRMKIKGEGR